MPFSVMQAGWFYYQTGPVAVTNKKTTDSLPGITKECHRDTNSEQIPLTLEILRERQDFFLVSTYVAFVDRC